MSSLFMMRAQGGSVELDGVDVRRLEPTWLRMQVRVTRRARRRPHPPNSPH